MSDEFALLEFRLTTPQALPPNHTFKAIGDHPALGCWNPLNAVNMEHEPDDDRAYRSTTPVSVPAHVTIAYKYLLFHNDTLVRWEHFEHNRILRGDDGNRSTAIDVFDQPPPPEADDPDNAELMDAEAAGGFATRTSSSTNVPDAISSGAVIVVSYMLPLVIRRAAPREVEPAASVAGADTEESANGGSSPTPAHGWDIEWNLDSVLAHGRAQGKRVVWVGCPGLEVLPEERESLAEALSHMSVMPVFLDRSLVESFYLGFCRSFLWPIMHNTITAGAYSSSSWRAYCTVNRLFADKVIEVYDVNDIVWVHDYHLLLLPTYTLRHLHNACVGLFLHTPFPSSEIFRTIPVRDELLRGMLNAEIVGFHLFEYARHFLTCCKRMIGLDLESQVDLSGFIGVRDQKRLVRVIVSHAGIEPSVLASFDEGAENQHNNVCEGPISPRLPLPSPGSIDPPAHSALVRQIMTTRSAGRKVLLGIDEVERLKGIPLKLLAFEQLLRNTSPTPAVTLVQVGVKARFFTPAVQADYEAVSEEIAEVRTRLDAEFPGSLIFTEVPTITLRRRLELWRLADVAVILPIREGLNTYPLEAVFARRTEPAGVVILSEFASCSRVLNGAIRCNPWATDEVVAAMARTLAMDDVEREGRRARDLEFITTTTASAWAERFVLDLQDAAAQPHEQWEAIGFGLAGFRRAGWRSDFNELDTTEVLTAYRRARKRAIFVDWGGTLVPIENGFTSTLFQYYRDKLPPHVAACLEELASDPRNLLMVISGQERSMMDAAFADMPNVSLAAEHGYFYRLGSMPGIRRPVVGPWQPLLEGFDLSWKEGALAVMEAYTARTNGAQISHKGSSLVWKYDEVDPDFGAMQAKELSQYLEGLLAEEPVQVTTGKGYIEVRPKGVDKGAVIDHVLTQLQSQVGDVGFVLCLGDDSADEFMFDALNARYPNASKTAGAPAVFSAVVGRKPSAAHYYLNDADEVVELFQSLRLHSTRDNRNRSMNDLQRLSNNPRQLMRHDSLTPGGLDGQRAAVGRLPVSVRGTIVERREPLPAVPPSPPSTRRLEDGPAPILPAGL